MLVSVYTPTHHSRYLCEAYNSLVVQTYKDWEWVILPNGNIGPNDIDPSIKADPRVRILDHLDQDRPNIGQLKKRCCDAARGELLVELDHDDSLTPDALELLVAEQQRTGAGFLFSDSITYYPNYESETYREDHGWEHYNYVYEGRLYRVARSFPITARSLCEIFYAPNHVRAWTRDAYKKAGGYDEKRPAADDHDLMCRTYLAGVKFHQLPRPVYLYRRHDANYCEQQAEIIYQNQLAVMNKYTHRLVFEWCRREKLSLIDLGGAHGCPREWGFKSVDCRQNDEVDILADVVTGVNFHEHIPDNSVGCFRAWDFFEHIRPGADIIAVMNRLYRCLAPGGWIISATPAVSDNEGRVGRGAFQDPTHVSYWSDNNWWYFTDRNHARYIPDFQGRFQAVRVWTEYPSEWHFRNQIPYVMADLVALKGQREAGESLI